MSHTDAFFHRGRRQKKVAMIVAITAAGFVVLLGLGALVVVDGLQRASVIRERIGDAQTALVNRNIAGASAAVTDATIELETIESRVQLFHFLEPVPYLGNQVASLIELVDDGRQSLEIIKILLEIGVDIEADLRSVGLVEGLASVEHFTELTPEMRKELVFSLSRRVPDLEQARARLSQQRLGLEALDGDELFFGLRLVRTELLDQIRRLDDTLNVLIPILSVLPDMGGFHGAQHYLLFLQNDGELRPTGGFWGTYGVIRVENGEIAEIFTDDVYAVDFPSEGSITAKPPLPMQRYLGIDTWYLRDVNWSPDVPASAQKALELYAQETRLPDQQYVTAPRVNFQGVILVNPQLGVELLKLFGDVDTGSVTFTPENFYDVLEFEVEQAFVHKGIETLDRKDVIGEMIDILFARLQDADSDQLGSLAQITLQLLDNNDIMVYGTDPAVQRIFEREHWAGDVRIHAEHDHLMIVDTNLAALKTDKAITRAYTYSVHTNPSGDLIATAQINYDHLGGFDYRTTRYRTYTRVYAPLGSELIRVEGSLLNDRTKNPSGAAGAVDISEEFGATVFGTFTAVEPGANGQLSFTYKLPEYVKEMVERGEYILDIQRQPGVGGVALNLDLDLGMPIVSATPAEVSEFWFNDSYTYTTQARPFQTVQIELETKPTAF
ncbi:TPA: hypothetical protein DEB00_00930 [Candidatus Uhrbacteria bacterium]|nr:hypothetical protein [Candidatus Uhrbacteria bacterium]